jgi:hypothetical protein
MLRHAAHQLAQLQIGATRGLFHDDADVTANMTLL